MHTEFDETCPQCIAERTQREKEAATPSITVGTQVRLTGVVTGPTRKSDGAIGVQIEGNVGESRFVMMMPDDLEVIRQPFKRGEVVWSLGEPEEDSEPEPFVVVNDETDGSVDVCCCFNGVFIGQQMAELYERRP